ncbi:hypothetical protein Dda_3081 [Drechslerella dactyloides]|uniref:DUF1996 domain-containing protein n=1 Tax=Drechslerella dactyloides TaxID=74499 RepID=A0AAD6J0N6_DREDA|nr:hypothetical protein Dda_3081 [Drechslerella dactyloides]
MRQSLSLAALALLGSGVDAFWRMQCGAPVVIDRVDPIVFPGQVDGHVHNVMGGVNFGKTVTTKQLKASKCTSCQVEPDKSNYWVPALYFQFKNGSYMPVPQKDGMLVYYIPERGAKYGEVLPFPENFGMIAGDPKLQTYDESNAKGSEARMRQDAIGFTCLNYKSSTTEGFANHRNLPEMSKLATCVDGLRADINFPSCWNGKLDSPNHRDHMAYPDGLEDGKCPETHPKRLITLKFEVSFMVATFASEDGEFIWSTGDKTGYSYHGDFYNGWDEKVLKTAMADESCVPKVTAITGGVIEDCKTFVNGKLLQAPEKQHECKIEKTFSGVNHQILCDKVDGMMGAKGGASSAPAAAAAPAKGKKGKGKGKTEAAPDAAPAAAAAEAPAKSKGKGKKNKGQPTNEQPKEQKPPVHAKDVIVTVTEVHTATRYVASTTTCTTIVTQRVRRHFRFHRRSD